MKNILITLSIVIFIMLSLFYIYPYAWKLSGGTFFWGNKMIYEGRVLFEKEGCIASWSKDFSKIELICPNKQIRFWINGVEDLKNIKD